MIHSRCPRNGPLHWPLQGLSEGRQFLGEFNIFSQWQWLVRTDYSTVFLYNLWRLVDTTSLRLCLNGLNCRLNLIMSLLVYLLYNIFEKEHLKIGRLTDYLLNKNDRWFNYHWLFKEWLKISSWPKFFLFLLDRCTLLVLHICYSLVMFLWFVMQQCWSLKTVFPHLKQI